MDNVPHPDKNTWPFCILIGAYSQSPMPSSTVVTAEAPVNIALVKYWGKRDPLLNIPTNDSISITLETLTEFCEGGEPSPKFTTTTTVAVAGGDEDDRIILNGIASTPNARVKRCLSYIRSIRSLPAVRIESRNAFPTAAGLASSASGYAALVMAISRLTTPPLTEEEASIAARLGSGSACRSLSSGFVRWRAGDLPDGSDSLASPILPVEHWPELRCMVVILSEQEKKVSSTEGMHRTIITSSLFPGRLTSLPYKICMLEKALQERNLPAFAELVMRESNQLHALCLDSFPPIQYLNERAFALMGAIQKLNDDEGSIIAGYTFDAGPNAFIFCQEDSLMKVRATVQSTFPTLPPHTRIVACKVGQGARIVS